MYYQLSSNPKGNKLPKGIDTSRKVEELIQNQEKESIKDEAKAGVHHRRESTTTTIAS